MIDVGCGAGRHAFEAYRRGADVVAFDKDAGRPADVDAVFAAMADAGEVPTSANAETVNGDVLQMPYDDQTFDCVIASEILEHIPQDGAAIQELIRVLKAGGTLAVTRAAMAAGATVLAAVGGVSQQRGRTRADLSRQSASRRDSRQRHGDDTHPSCARAAFAVLVAEMCCRDVTFGAPSVTAYHKVLVWDLMRRPKVIRLAESVLNPLIGKSVAMYFTKPEVAVALV